MPMATKSKLEQAVEAHAASLNEAQSEIILSQLSVYKQNKARISEIRDMLDAVNAHPTATLEELRIKQSQRTTLSYELNQIATANSRIASDLFDLLGERQ